jgi:predicted RNA-binding protein YlxR (DUF448 family)
MAGREPRRGMEADEGLAERMCIVTREVKDEAELVRFVRGPDGDVVPDIDRKLPGRGVWVSLSRERVAEAVRRKAFSRGLGETKVDPHLADVVASLLRKAALSYLSLAKKAGALVAGSVKVEGLLASGKVRLLLHAQDAARGGQRKLEAMAGPDTATVRLFAVDEMSLALGRPNVIHAAVTAGGIAEKLLTAARRAEAYETRPGTQFGKEA